jgi:cell wall-associated NlpC family hydrolase
MSGVNGPAVASVAIGSLFVWSGFKGWSVLATAGEVLTGKTPQGTNIHALASPDPGNASGGSTGGSSDLSSIALGYQGHLYLYGGAPGIDGNNPWDCSSFVNWCRGKRQGKAIPGIGPGKYNGSVHGPPTGLWGIWPGLRRISRSDVQAGDIVVWTLHMGIAINNKQMISATGPDGTPSTVIGDIDGGSSSPLLKYGRFVA